MDDHNQIVDRYVYARLAGDTATMANILKDAAKHDQGRPDEPPLMPLLTDAAFRYPAPSAEG